MNKLTEYTENFDQPLYLPSHVESLKEKRDYFEVYQILRQRYHDIAILITGNNKTSYKFNTSNTTSFRTLFLLKIQSHKSKSFPTF